MKNICFVFVTLFSCLFGGFATAGGALPTSDIYKVALEHDAALFAAYNECRLDALGALVADDLEFYHDQGGVTLGKLAFIDSIRKYVCGKAERKLVQAGFEVFEMKGFGFIETGEHTFCNKVETPICDDKTNGIGKFLILWKKTETGYVVTRVMSYDHINSRDREFTR